MIQYPHENEFRERRRIGEGRRQAERRRVMSRRRGEAERQALVPDPLFANWQNGDHFPENQADFAELRHRAEEALRLESMLDRYEALSTEDRHRVLHELRVRQIETELQNEELRRTQQDLETAKGRYLDLYDLAPVGYCTLNEHNQILDANLTLSALLGTARSGLIKDRISRFVLAEDQDIYYLNLRRLLETGVTQGCEVRMRKAGGTVFWARLEAALAQGVEGEPVCRLVMSDISARKRMEAENRQLQKAESLTRMAGAIAHHFNNQLQAVMASLELLEELPPGIDSARFLTMAKRASEKAAEVSRMMLLYLGQASDQRDVLSLSDLCQEYLPLLKAMLPKTVTLEVDLPSPGPIVIASANQIQQLLTNLVTNAWEAMGGAAGNIQLNLGACAATEIPSANRFPAGWQPQQPDYACLEVADTGCGIGEANLDKVFDPFFTTKFAGRGLGLSVVLGIAQAHGAAITVESKQGQGSVFRVYFPVAPDLGQ